MTIKELFNYVHDIGGNFICDNDQEIPHHKVDVKDLDVDFYVFSGHKMLGPTGIGVCMLKKS